MENWLKTQGVISVEREFDRVVVNLPLDFIYYYKWFCERYTHLKIDQPTFGSHVTLGIKQIHPKLNFNTADQYEGDIVEFEYSNRVRIGGWRAGFLNFWVPVRSPKLEKIRKHIRAFDNKDFQGLHVTIGNNKAIVALDKKIRKDRAQGITAKRLPPHMQDRKEYSVLEFWPPLIEVRNEQV